MKLSKREKNSYIVWFVFNILVFVVFIYVWYKQYIEYKNIDVIKKDTISIINEKREIEKNWINYWTFIAEVKKDSKIEQSLLLKLKKEDYESNFSNTWSIDFKSFIDDKAIEVKDMYDPGEEIKPILDKVIPTYNQKLVPEINYDYITEYSFVNYLEKISYFFGLDIAWSANQINLTELKKDSSADNSSDWENIYYVDYDFSVYWVWYEIINFIHFFENVWWIDTTSDNRVILKSDDFIKNQNLFPKFYTWYKNNDEEKWEYNIYGNIFWEITNLSIDSYPDEENNPFKEANWLTVADYVKNFKWDEDYSINIWIRFYFKWLPYNQVKNVVEKFVTDYNETKELIKKDIDKLNSSRSSNYSLNDDILFEKLTSLYKKLDKNTTIINNVKTNLDSYNNYEKVNRELKDHMELLKSIKRAYEKL